MRFIGRALSGVFLLTLTLALLAWAGVTVRDAVEARLAGKAPAAPARERVFAVNVVTAEARDRTPVLSAFGDVRSRRKLEVRATAAGTVTDVGAGVETGGRVAAGDLLFRVDQAEARSALARVRADMADAQAEARDAARALELAQADLAAASKQSDLRAHALARQQDLRSRGIGTDADVETAALAAAAAEQAVVSREQAVASSETRVALAKARLERTSLDLADAERALSDTTVTAKFDGTLADTAIVEGGVLTRGERVATLIDPAELEVAFRVSTAEYARLIDGGGALRPRPVTAALDVAGADLTATGTIDRESGEVGEGETGRLIFARLDRAPGFRPGDFVTVTVEEPVLENAVRLPARALSAANRVLVVGEDDRLAEMDVALLRRQGDAVLVRAPGLSGRQVVAERSPLLGAGIRVRPLKAQADAAEQALANTPQAPQTVALSDARRARLMAFVESNARMPKGVKDRLLSQLREARVPATVVERLETRMGG